MKRTEAIFAILACAVTGGLVSLPAAAAPDLCALLSPADFQAAGRRARR